MNSGRYKITSPHGPEIEIPVSVTDDDDPAFDLDSLERARGYYDEQGYVVIRGLIPQDVCAAAHAGFLCEVKPYDGHLYRQASARSERHEFTDTGFMLNSILNIQDIGLPGFDRFRAAAMGALTHDCLQRASMALQDEPGKIVQTMYFEGNPVTWAHQDTYYLDAEDTGRMTAAWLALEDIHPGAGRFYVYPGSHQAALPASEGAMDVAYNHDRYKAWILGAIKANYPRCRAPALSRGDVVFWNSKTIHGSLETTEPAASRNSLTAHFIPESERFLQLRSRIKPLQLKIINGVPVHHPKDLGRWRNRLVFALETHFPSATYAVKNIAVKMLTR